MLQGIPIESITSLRDLVDPIGNVRTIMTFFWERASCVATTQTAGIAEVLRQVAAFHCRLPAAHVAQIAKWKKNVTPERCAGLTEKNRRRLRTLADRNRMAALLHLPAKLMELAEDAAVRANEEIPPDMETKIKKKRRKSRRAELLQAEYLARMAVALELLIICPLRIENLRTLEIGRELQRLGSDRRRITHIFVPSTQTKNRAPVEWPVNPISAAVIDRYIEAFRPTIAPPGSAALFPARDGGPQAATTLGSAITKTIRAYLGINVNAHLMRHFAAWRYLKRHPGQYEIVRLVLGHKSVDTTVQHYTGLEAEFAAAHFDEAILEDRRETKLEAAVFFAGRPGRRQRKGR